MATAQNVLTSHLVALVGRRAWMADSAATAI
jgi:hypothetical protein